MNYRHQILMVAQQVKVANRLTSWASAAGYDVTVATTFAAAKSQLEMVPDLIIAEVKLAEYNGLHLALRAHAAGIPAIIIGCGDAVLEREAQAIGALYLKPAITRTGLLDAIRSQLSASVSAQPVSTRPAARMSVTTVASEAEMMWRAFSESTGMGAYGLGRNSLPN